MARKPQDLYPGQVVTGNPGFPYGQARNVGVLGDGDGFPFEKEWVNEHLAFLQGLLVAAGITPDGTPETATASQYVAAVRYLTRHINGNAIVDGALDVHDDLDVSAELSVQGLTKLWGGFTSPGGQINGILQVIGALQAAGGLIIPAPLGALIQQRGLTAAPAGTTLGTGGDAVLQIPVSAQDAIRFSGSGRLVRRIQNAADADASFSFSGGDRIVIPATVTGPHAYTLLEDSFIEAGAEVRIINWSIYNHFILSGGTPVAAIAVDTSNLLANDWRPGVIDFMYHNNGVTSRWFPTGRPAP